MKKYIECDYCNKKIYLKKKEPHEVIWAEDGYFCSENCYLNYMFSYHVQWLNVDEDFFERQKYIEGKR